MEEEESIAIQEHETSWEFFVLFQVHSIWLNKMPHCLLRSVISIINVFHSYAKSDGDCQRLNKTELKKLLQQEFGNAPEVRRTVGLLPIYSVTWDCLLGSNGTTLSWFFYLSSYFFLGLFQVPLPLPLLKD